MRFFRQLCTAAKVDEVVALTKEALAGGQCVVIGLQSTGDHEDDQAAVLLGGGKEEEEAVCGSKNAVDSALVSPLRWRTCAHIPYMLRSHTVHIRVFGA